jgi:hypothetical protein
MAGCQAAEVLPAVSTVSPNAFSTPRRISTATATTTMRSRPAAAKGCLGDVDFSIFL